MFSRNGATMMVPQMLEEGWVKRTAGAPPDLMSANVG